MTAIYCFIELIKHQAPKIGLLLLLCVGSSILFFISFAIFGESSFYLLAIFPMTSPFIHASMPHFVENLLMLVLLTLPVVNRFFTFKQLWLITIVLSFIYMPVVLFGFSQPVVGLSGLGYFLLTRFVLANKVLRFLILSLFCLVLIGELLSIGAADDIAHGFHLLSAGCGFISHENNLRLLYRN